MEEYTFKICKSSWGVYVKLIAEYVQMDFALVQQTVQIDGNIWLKYSDKPLVKGKKFWDGDIPYLKKGLQLVKENIKTKSKYQHTLIVVHDIIYNPCDFQVEGIIAATIGWSAKAFEFTPPNINVSFNKVRNKYEFEF